MINADDRLHEPPEDADNERSVILWLNNTELLKTIPAIGFAFSFYT